MITFKQFLEKPVEAVAMGYNPSIIDTMALICSFISRNNAKEVLTLWLSLASTPVKHLPRDLLVAVFNTFLFASFPFFFWLYAILLHWQLKPMAEEMKEIMRKIEEDLNT
ncbi:hypothetical protein AD45P4_00305 [Alteromonas phage vB_AmaP_AD45-P4]|nr:hypothetical protein AD45P3_00310 [Alteromonas phage vB_AmaP_AD45-P3]AGM47116.1 hypothetical protein AD45P4_00305 [Alteromonas phage vB_AmaP_AD45-P4]